MMEKYFCNYNQSLALKELGFEEPCFAGYRDSEWIGTDGPNSRYFHAQLFSNHQFDDDQKKYCSAPLKSQVFEWMRDKHFFSAHIDDFTANNGQVRYDFSIRELGSQDDNPNGMYEEYSDAESACIDALIKRVKERIK